MKWVGVGNDTRTFPRSMSSRPAVWKARTAAPMLLAITSHAKNTCRISCRLQSIADCTVVKRYHDRNSTLCLRKVRATPEHVGSCLRAIGTIASRLPCHSNMTGLRPANTMKRADSSVSTPLQFTQHCNNAAARTCAQSLHLAELERHFITSTDDRHSNANRLHVRSYQARPLPHNFHL